MQRGVAAIVALFIVTGLGGTDGHDAGLSRAQAETLALEQARTQRETVFFPDFWERRSRELIDMFPSRNSRGEDAWLAIFRLTGVENDPDQACVWVWRATEPPDEFGFEESVSVAYGAVSDPVHQRCAEEVFSRGIADPEQTGGVEMAPPVFSRPVPVTPFGPRPAVLYPRDLASADSGISISGIGVELPVGSSPGTCGFAGFVLDEDTERPVPGATITVKPSGAWSGVSEGDKTAAATARTDELGGFVLLDFPDEALGYDVTIDAPGYATVRIVHQSCYVGSYAEGDWLIGRTPRFEDATPVPVRR
jgi:hypothetical protein